MPFVEGEVYKGKIVNARDFGFFVKLRHPESGAEREGLVHIAQILQGQKRLEKPEESGFRVGDAVFVKLLQIRDDKKLSLSMKACDQASGGEVSARQDGRHLLKRSLEQAECFDAQGRKVGALTGVLLEDSGVKVSRRGGVSRMNRMSSPDMWEMKQLKGGQALHLVQDASERTINLDDQTPEDLNEEYAELELNEEEAPFLKGTSREGMVLEPIKISRDPDGGLQQAAMKQSQFAKDRKDIREH